MLDILWVLLCSGLVFLMQAGFMCLESGLTRSKNNINVAVKNFLDFGISVALFWLFGYGLMFGASQVGWLGWGSFTPTLSMPESAVFFLFQAMFCGTATTIISGAIAERLNFNSYLLIAALVSGLIYPLFGHWAWNGLLADNSGGWLQIIGFVDFAGSTVVHSTGAWVSLATLLIVGARQGRFSKTGTANKIQGANMPFSVLGILLLWFGWIGFNGGSTLAFNDQVPGIVVNTMLAGVMGLLTAAALSALQHRRVEVEVIINGAIAGLVAITACCHVVTTPLAAVVGMTGAAVATVVEYWMVRSRLDDAVGAVAVHGGAGIWGTLCVALFGQLPLLDTGLTRLSQLFVQLLGCGICFAWAFGVSWVGLRLLNRVMPLRVPAQAEVVGLNISEHHAKTDTYDLFQVMDQQAETQDLSLRVPVEPFTEIGHIATRYNQVMANLERQHQQQVDDLGHIYHLVAIASSALETNTFTIQDPELEELSERYDDLGNLARVFQQLLMAVQTRQQTLETLWPLVMQADVGLRQQIVTKMVRDRLPTAGVAESDAIAHQMVTQLDQYATFADVLAAIDASIPQPANRPN
ncbi:MAG: ammonium transporter [Cyanothece sp. SIO2G6]|nr:ammonium transporter [Cyanothece sp. SIO2G6]